MADLPRNATEAIYQRLSTGERLTVLVADRIYPNKGDGSGTKPYICFWCIGGGGGSSLTEVNRLQQYTYRVEFHADTDDLTEELRRETLDRLCGNPRKQITPWRDMAAGVQTCRPVPDAEADTLDDGTQVAGQTVSIWFCPQV